MSDATAPRPIYVSFAEADRAFVRQLVEALTRQNRTIQGRWQDMTATPDVLDVALRTSQALVFVISPDSATDAACLREIEQAQEREIIIVPVLHRGLSDDERDELQKHLTVRNWVSFLDLAPDAECKGEDADDEPRTFMTAFTELVVRLQSPAPTTRHIAFISYSRKNTCFVRQLYLAFDAANQNVWVDWEDIPPGVDFPETIRQGILHSDNLIVVMSPTYHASEYCNLEMHIAREAGIRLIPVLRQNVTDDTLQVARNDRGWDDRVLDQKWIEDNRQTVGDINWVYARTTDSFETAFTKIQEAIQHDDDHYQRHRDLSIQAEAWRAGSGQLLRDNNLRQAETWLAEGSEKHPRPSPLHIEYITESQQDERERSRQRAQITSSVAGVLGVLLCAALVLGTVAYIQRNRAIENEQIAQGRAVLINNQLQAQIMEARSILQPVGDTPNRPFLLGPHAWITNKAGQIWRLRADNGQPDGDPITVEPASPLYRPVFDGTYLWIASTGGGSTLTRLDPANLTSAQTITLEVPPSAPPIITGDSWLWIATERKLLQINRETLEMGASVRIGIEVKYPIFDGEYLWVVDNARGNMHRVHHVTGEQDKPIQLGDKPQAPVLAGGSLWVTDALASTLWQIDPAAQDITQATIQTIEIDQRVGPPAVSGGYLWIIGNHTDTSGDNPVLRYQIVQIDPASGTVIQRIETNKPVRSVHAHQGRLWVLENEGTVFWYDLNTYEAHIPDSPENIHAADLTVPVFTDRHLWAAYSAGRTVYVLNLDNGQVMRRLTQCVKPTQPVFDGAVMWISCQGDGTAVRIPAMVTYYGDTDSLEDTVRAGSKPAAPVLINEYLWIVQDTLDRLLVFNLRTEDGIPETIPLDIGTFPSTPRLDQNGRYLWIMDSEQNEDDRRFYTSLYRFDTQDIGQVQRYEIATAEGGELLLHGDQAWGWLVDSVEDDVASPELVQFDLRTEKVVNVFELGDMVSGFTLDGNILWVNAVGASGGLIYRFNATTGTQLGEPVALDHSPAGDPVIIDDSVWISGAVKGNPINAALQLVNPEGLAEVLRGALYEFSREDGTLQRTIPLEHSPGKVVSDGQHLWFTQLVNQIPMLNATEPWMHSLLTVLDPVTYNIVAEWSPCGNLQPPYYDGRLLWATCIGMIGDAGTGQDEGHVWVIDPHTDPPTMLKQYNDLGRGAWPVTPIGEYVWMVYRDTGNAAVFRAGTGELVRLFGLGNGASPLVFDGAATVYFSNTQDATVQRLRLTPLDTESESPWALVR